LAKFIPLDQELIVQGQSERQTLGAILERDKPKLLAIYYSMHTCPPCREFTPLLAALYEEVNEDEK
jgi:nucleoredoxin